MVAPNLRVHAPRVAAVLLLQALGGCTCSQPVHNDAGVRDGEVPDGEVPDGEIPRSDGPPAFITTPPDTVAEGDTYLYGALAEDPDGQIIRYTLITGPTGLVVAEATGAVYWAVPQDAAGSHELVIDATDEGGSSVRQSASITVTRVNVAPRIVSVAPRHGTLGDSYRYDVVATDADGDSLAYTLRTGPAGARFDAATFVWPSATAGATRIEIAVADPDGETAVQSFAIGVATGAGGSGPAVRIDDPFAGTTIEVTTPVVGEVTDFDFDLVGWVLEGCQPDAAGSCLVIARGDGEVSAGVLGQLDPAPFLDDALALRLTAWDAEGNENTATQTVAIASRAHPGLFGIEMVDLVTRVDGQRVELVRIYDSRRLHSSDFGVGWELSSNIERGMAGAPPVMTAASSFSTGWEVVFAFPSVYLDPTAGHDVELALPDGRLYVFTFAPEPDGFTTEFARPIWLSAPGTSIEPITLGGGPYGDTTLAIINTGSGARITNLDISDYEPPAFRIRTDLGETFDFERDGRLIRSTGYTPPTGGGSGPRLMTDGVYGSRGRVVEFERDGMGRITRIHDTRYPRDVTYEYAPDGLVAVVHPPEAARSTYEYAAGRLASYALPDGLGLTRLEFDERGRLTRKILPEGGILVYTYDDVARTVRVRDAAGGDLLVEHDERGDVVATTNALGEREVLEHDDAGRQTLRIDGAGRQTRWRYDALGNMVEVAEPGRALTTINYEGNVATEVRGERGRVESLTSPDGRTGTLVGPGGGELYRAETDAEGRVIADGRGTDLTRYDYDAEGRVDHYETEGHAYDLSYSAGDLRIDATDEDGNTFYTEEGPDGEPLEIGAGTEAIRYDYDFDGNLVGVEAGEETVRYDYDPAGNLLAVEHDGEEVARRQYDGAGRLVLDRDADGAFTRYRYDDAGRLVAEVSSAGTTEVTYDRGGLPVEQRTPDGVNVMYARDANGRVTRVADSTGSDVTIGYDASGRVASLDDGSGAATFDHDPTTGLVSAVHTPVGDEEYTYDMRFADPDPAATPPLASVREPNGALWTYERDTSARLTAVVHPDGIERTAYAYEPDSERVTRITDARSNDWTFEWDDERLLETRTPEGLVTRYDESGDGTSTVTRPDGSTERISVTGDTVVRAYDGLELVFRTDGERLVATESPAAAVRYQHDASGAVIGVERTDGARATITRGRGGRVEAIEVVSPTGERARTTYEYGTNDDRVVAIVDPSGGRSAYEYDGDRVAVITRPNGVRSEYVYAACGRPSSIRHLGSGGASMWSATFEYGPGCVLEVAALPEGRREYDYDAHGRLIEERVLDAGGATTARTTHVYDGFGNRIETTDGTGTTARTYDRDGRVRSAAGPAGTTTYEYDGRGNLIREAGPAGERRVDYDAADRVVAIHDGTTTHTLGYDAEGHLSSVGAEQCLAVPDGVLDRSSCLAFYGGGGPMRTMVHGPEGVAGDATAGAMRWMHGGLNQSAVLVSGDGGVEMGRASWDGYGVEESDSRPSDVRHGYAGEITVGGLVYLRSRWYAPSLGAFTSPDRERAEVNDPRTLHRYLYALGSPTNYVLTADLTS